MVSLWHLKKKTNSIDKYKATFASNIQVILQQLRQAIREAVPQAQETITYQMPAFKQNGIRVWFAAFKNHRGFFPKASAIEVFKEKLLPYETSKGTIQFALDQPLPLELIKEIVKYRVKENCN